MATVSGPRLYDISAVVSSLRDLAQQFNMDLFPSGEGLNSCRVTSVGEKPRVYINLTGLHLEEFAALKAQLLTEQVGLTISNLKDDPRLEAGGALGSLLKTEYARTLHTVFVQSDPFVSAAFDKAVFSLV